MNVHIFGLSEETGVLQKSHANTEKLQSPVVSLHRCIASRDSFLTPLSFLHLSNMMQAGRPLQVVLSDQQTFRCIPETVLCRLQPLVCYSR